MAFAGIGGSIEGGVTAATGGLDLPLMAGISGAGNILGGLFGQATSAQFQQGQVQQQEQFQEMMSNTAYQRAMTGMESAGLNPILAAGGQGASTPSGAMAPGSNIGSNILGGGTNSALSSIQTGQNINSQQAQIDNTDAKTRLLDAQTSSLTSSAASHATSDLTQAMKDRNDQSAINSWFGKNIAPYMDLVSGRIGNAANAVSSGSNAMNDVIALGEGE